MTELENLKGKKLLILGGSDLHSELVRTAKRLGVETYVTDYLPMEHSPAKQLADHAWHLSITDIDAIVERCREEKIDGVLNMYYDSCQRPNQEICERLGLPCFGTREQYEIFTNKQRFLETCVKYGVDIIPQYREEDFAFDNPEIKYPIYVKPCDSSGAHGQTICRSYAEIGPAIARARAESKRGDIIIQQYMEDATDLQISFFLIDGEIYINFLADLYDSSMEGGTRILINGISPSIHRELLIEKVFPKVQNMLLSLGLRNSPIFLQGFLDGDKVLFYDPALRLPGSLYEQNLREATGVDVFEALIRFAFTGVFPEDLRRMNTCHLLNNTYSVGIRVYLRPGTICRVEGMDLVQKGKRVTIMHHEGDKIEDWQDIRQCFCEIVFLRQNMEETVQTIQSIYRDLRILDENGEDMKILIFDTARLQN